MRVLWLLRLLLLLSIALTLPAWPLAAQGCTDEAETVSQELDPPATALAPDAEFTATWTLRNTGDCTWSRTYRLLFVEGERMDSPRTVRLRNAVEPGETLTLSLDLVAPTDEGSYSGTWQLRNGDGESFGPPLTLQIEVGGAAAATTEVVLPEVLVFGGMGSGDDPNALLYCLDGGELPATPTLRVDRESLEWRYTTLYLCSLPEGTEVTVEIADPLGNRFHRDYVEDAPVVAVDDAGNEYVGSVLQVHLGWLAQSPAGAWSVTATSEAIDYQETLVIDLPPLPASTDDTYPRLDNWPVDPIDPFATAQGCHYGYPPGAEMHVSGWNLLPNATIPIGLYHDRLGNGYLSTQFTVQTDSDGRFATTYTAPLEHGSYNLITINGLSPDGYSADGAQYDPSYGGETVFSCFSVVLEEPERPLRLAFVAGDGGVGEVQVYDLWNGMGYYPVYTANNCDASAPAWWPDGEWVIYQSNCVRDDSQGWVEMSEGDSYDLYASLIDFTYTLPDEEKLVQLTNTPRLDETEPDANMDGLIVYRQTRAGASLEESGELHLFDPFGDASRDLGLVGRAPTWSPDGTRIAFMSDAMPDGDGTWQIYLYDVEREELTLVSEDCATHCRMPAWSPNGRQIIYEVATALDDLTPAALWIASTTGLSNPREFLVGEYGQPTWSAEGWVIFQGPDGLYRATTGREPTVERYLYSQEWAVLSSPAWSH